MDQARAWPPQTRIVAVTRQGLRVSSCIAPSVHKQHPIRHHRLVGVEGVEPAAAPVDQSRPAAGIAEYHIFDLPSATEHRLEAVARGAGRAVTWTRDPAIVTQPELVQGEPSIGDHLHRAAQSVDGERKQIGRRSDRAVFVAHHNNFAADAHAHRDGSRRSRTRLEQPTVPLYGRAERLARQRSSGPVVE